MARRRVVTSSPVWLLVGAVVGLTAGAVLYFAGVDETAQLVWAITTVAGIMPATWWVFDALRRRKLGVDLMALLVLVGTLVIGEYLAGAVITVMLASGRMLESRAAGRARRELRSLLERTPKAVHRYVDGLVTEPALDAVKAGDLLLVKPGEVVPVDGMVESVVAVLDESALTGEPLPVERSIGEVVRSGVVNAGAPFDMRATTSASDSTYAGIVRLVASAEADTAPFVRLADRYAGVFLIVSLVIALAAWVASGEVERAIAVLVVATPCPLILAAPVAIASGLSRAARRGVIVKGGGVLERLADCTVLLFDKTGTLTAGWPDVIEVSAADERDGDETLRLAASLEQVSPHVLAASLVRGARLLDLELVLPSGVQEVAGQGVRGRVEGHLVTVGNAAWMAHGTEGSWAWAVRRRAERDGAMAVYVEIDDRLAGVIVLEDQIRVDAPRTIRRIRHDGISRVVMVTGDRYEVAEDVGALIGVDDVLAERTPAEKVEAVRLERAHGPTIMVGDGINDAPALALADVGVAIGARGASASSEAADVVLTVDRLDRLGDAVAIAVGLDASRCRASLSASGCRSPRWGLRPLGLLAPVWGAILQECIDVAVIANALRALRGAPGDVRFDREDTQLALRFSVEHRRIRADIDRIRTVADHLGVVPARGGDLRGPRNSPPPRRRDRTSRRSRRRRALSSRGSCPRWYRPDRDHESRPRRDPSRCHPTQSSPR